MRSLPPRYQVVVYALIALAAMAIVVGFVTSPATSTTSVSGTQPAQEKTHDSYSDLLAAANEGKVESFVYHAGNGKADVVYADRRIADVVLPADNASLLDRLAADGTTVSIDGHPSGASSDGGGSLLAALLPTLLLIGFVLLI